MSVASTSSAASRPVSPLRPFRHRAFAVIWTATLVSNIGIWMQNAAAGWLMATLDPEPQIVAMVQVAAAMPMFLLGLPAGAFADMFDRRRLLLTMETVGTLWTASFALLTALGRATPVTLLAFLFLAGAAAASIAPAWQAILPQLVEGKDDLAAAVSLDSVGINISRAIGPALAGLIIGCWGMAAPFWLNACCNLGVIAALACATRVITGLYGSHWHALSGSSCSRARIGRCCRCWRAIKSPVVPGYTGCCWVPSARGPSSAHSSCHTSKHGSAPTV